MQPFGEHYSFKQYLWTSWLFLNTSAKIYWQPPESKFGRDVRWKKEDLKRVLFCIPIEMLAEVLVSWVPCSVCQNPVICIFNKQARRTWLYGIKSHFIHHCFKDNRRNCQVEWLMAVSDHPTQAAAPLYNTTGGKFY